MVKDHPDKYLEIKKGELWELWLVSPPREIILGAFNTLEELSQVQATIYNSWERARYATQPHLAHLWH